MLKRQRSYLLEQQVTQVRHSTRSSAKPVLRRMQWDRYRVTYVCRTTEMSNIVVWSAKTEWLWTSQLLSQGRCPAISSNVKHLPQVLQQQNISVGRNHTISNNVKNYHRYKNNNTYQKLDVLPHQHDNKNQNTQKWIYIDSIKENENISANENKGNAKLKMMIKENEKLKIQKKWKLV